MRIHFLRALSFPFCLLVLGPPDGISAPETGRGAHSAGLAVSPAGRRIKIAVRGAVLSLRCSGGNGPWEEKPGWCSESFNKSLTSSFLILT